MLKLTFLLILLLKACDLEVIKRNSIVNDFNLDLYQNFDFAKCDGERWQRVWYDAVNVVKYAESKTGIRSSFESCWSYPILFFEGVLEINVYIEASSQAGVSVELFGEDDYSILRYDYGVNSKEFIFGWHTISLQVNKYVNGYIQLRGKSHSNEIVIIDSVKYIPNQTDTNNYEAAKRNINIEDKSETEANIEAINQDDINTYKNRFNETFPREESSKTSSVSDFKEISEKEIKPADEFNRESEKISTWDACLIFLACFAIVIVLSITGVSAYHCGKIQATDKPIPTIYVDDLEIPRTIIIPRVTESLESASRFSTFD